MNTTVAEGISLVDGLRGLVADVDSVECVVCPPFVSLVPIADRLAGSGIRVGAQNVYFKEKGAYTGEVSCEMLAGIVTHVIVGHSERRQHFGDTDETVAEKVKAVMESAMTPILCVGETLKEREVGETEAVLRRQVNSALRFLNNADELVVAYEPVWAIGTGLAATALDANRGCAIIRDELERAMGVAVASATRILYGGSVAPDNAEQLMEQSDIDGALVGGASLKAPSFAAIVEIAARVPVAS
jgi:triosephosphate isomerase